jgi:hypothetical protein
MDLRNWEFYEENNQPLVGATVRVRDASLSHPNTGTVLASTVTDPNGMWAFTGLSNTAKDVEVIWGSSGQYHRWYKGKTQHGVSIVFFEDWGAPGTNNILKSAGWGKLTTDDVSNNAITQTAEAIGSAISPTTTSTTAVNMNDMAVTLTTSAGSSIVAILAGTFSHSTNGNVVIAINVDGGIGQGARVITCGTTSTNGVTIARFSGLSAASHTFRGLWNVLVGGTTATTNNTERSLVVMEFKK